MEMQLAYQLKRAQPDEAVYLVKYALGNTGLTPRVAPTWNPEVRNSLYDKAQQSLQAALNDLSAAGKTPRVAGFVWVQGGYDAKVKAPQADYARLQGQLFEGVRQTAQNPLLPIVDLLVRSEHYPLLVVNDAKAQLAARLPEIKLLSAEALQDIGDDMHYNGAASRAVGRHSFEYLTRQSYAPPSSLPVPLVHLDLNRQDGWALARLLKVKQVVDLSGHGMTFSSASSTPPTLIEGVLGKGFSSVRAEGGQALVAPRNPLTANRPYTVAAVIGNFANAKAAQARYLLGGGESNSLALYYPSGSNLLQLRHGQKTILKSRTPTASSPQIVIIVYDPTNSTMRVNGVSEATYRLAAPFSTAGKLRLFDFAGAQRSIKIDLSTMMMFDRALGLDEVQQLEGYLAHRFMLPLPASHPFAQVAPQ